GKEEIWLERACEELFLDYMLPHVATAGRGAVERHRTAGDVVAIVTGATPYAALPLARELGIEHVVATRLEVEDGRFTGNVAPPMAYGKGKIVLAERLAEEQGFALEEATFYSASITDLPLLERVRTPVVVNPDRRLRRVARARGWRIETWCNSTASAGASLGDPRPRPHAELPTGVTHPVAGERVRVGESMLRLSIRASTTRKEGHPAMTTKMATALTGGDAETATGEAVRQIRAQLGSSEPVLLMAFASTAQPLAQ